MVAQDGDGERKRRKSRVRRRTPRYWFLNGDLHKTLHINRPGDLITAWNFKTETRAGYSYTDMQKHHQRAFTTAEVSKMLNRVRLVLFNAIYNGDIDTPQMTHGLDRDRSKDYKYMWNEENIMQMHAFLATRHKGRPRNDGCITPMNLPSARELRAMIRQDVVLYVKTEDGNFVPTWKAGDF